MKSKTMESTRGALAALLVGGLLMGCSTPDPLPQEAALGVSQSALAPEPTAPGGVDAGDAAWVEQVVPALLGRPVRSFGELKFLTVMTARVGRTRMAEALMKHPAFVDRWTGVLLDRLRVDRDGARSQSDCFSQPLLTSDADQMAAAKVVLHTRRAGNDDGLSTSAGEPAAPSPPGTYTMADVVRGSLLIDNVFPTYRGFVFALVRKYGNDDAEEAVKQRQIAEHFTQVYTNKSMVCLQCHRTHSICSESYFTPGYDWSMGQEGRVFSGLGAWASSGMSVMLADDRWIGSFRRSSGETVPFAGWDGTKCGTFSDDTSNSTPSGTGLLLPDEEKATVWALDDRLKEGYLALRKSYDSGDLDKGSGYANQGRTLGAYWLAAAFANDVWRELFGAPLTIANFTSRKTDEHKLLWYLAEHHVVGRDWSLKGLLTEIVTSPYFNRLPESSATMPKVFEPFIDEPTKDYVGDAVHRRSADLLFRMKASALDWKVDGKLWVTHFPQGDTYPTLSEAEAMGLHISRLSTASPTSSQYSMLGWEASAGRCDRPAVISRDWIDALADRAMTGGVTVRGAVEALRFRLLGRGLSANSGEAAALEAFLGKSMNATFATAYTAAQGKAALRALCAVFVKTPQFMLEGAPHGVGPAATNFDSPPQLQVGDMKPDGTLAADTALDACESWVDPQTGKFDGISVDCTDESFPEGGISWSLLCPSGVCRYVENVKFDPGRPWPCLTCPFTPEWRTRRPPPVDKVLVANHLPMPKQPARGGVFLVSTPGGRIMQVSGQAQVVFANGQSAPAAVGMTLQVGDSLELRPGDTFKVMALDDGQVFESPAGGMPDNQLHQSWLFMIAGSGGSSDPPEMTPTTIDVAEASKIREAMRTAARNEEPGSVSFFHDVELPTGNMSHIDHPEVNGKPDLILLVSPVAGAVNNDHHVGVWYDTTLQRWAVYNEDLAAMPVGARFSIRAMKPSDSAFIYEVTSTINLQRWGSFIDHPALNGRPSVAVQVSHVWNPEGGYNDHPVGVAYNTSANKWEVYNEDRGTLQVGTTFAVKLGGAFKVTSSPFTRVGNALVIDEPNINGAPDARLFFTHRRTGATEIPIGANPFHTKRSALRYDTTLQKWTIVNLDGTPLENLLTFHVHRGY